MRYELKMTFPAVAYDTVLQQITSVSVDMNEIYHERRINNLYFDTLSYTDYLANYNGDSLRCKYRLRWYGQTYGVIHQPQLEIKRRRGNIGEKQLIAMPTFIFDENFNWYLYRQLILAQMSQVNDVDINALQNLLYRSPSLFNSYSRRYFNINHGQLRLTLDRCLRFNRPSFGCQPASEHFQIDLSQIVLELKFEQAQLPLARKLINQWGFRLTKNSKYVNGVQAVFGNTFKIN